MESLLYGGFVEAWAWKHQLKQQEKEQGTSGRAFYYKTLWPVRSGFYGKKQSMQSSVIYGSYRRITYAA